ncbi:hypothetical protein V466_29280 [Pseudomonas mandelii PD30]|uniref:Morphogenetic protein n=1 Tax=Pseudomonas mandelii PD30 TaxID=1419583 RepID=A0A059KTG2_9PSED|nr:hypothetical protein [Pseudomonas mandelii]KDD65352.1 hypothetical protein V466_29280 [Pseudomonas mandelii PD30]
MTQVKERPILFSTPMVRAILEGLKTVTRRAVNPQPVLTEGSGFSWKGHLFGSGSNNRETSRNFSRHCCPYGKPGDRLWVRETWARAGNGDPGYLTYRATYPHCLPPGLENIPPAHKIRWKPSIHMFRADSRILLEITDVRVERLQDISDEQAQAEGIIPVPKTTEDSHQFWRNYHLSGAGTFCVRTPKESFKSLWCHVAGGSFPKGEAAYKASPHSWDANPWVWVVEFKQVTP